MQTLVSTCPVIHRGNTGENAKAKTKFYHFTWTKPVLSIFIFTRKACMTSYNSELCSHFKSHMHTSALEDAWTNHILSAYLLLNKRIWKFCFFTVGLRCYTYKPKIPNSSHISKCQYVISTLYVHPQSFFNSASGQHHRSITCIYPIHGIYKSNHPICIGSDLPKASFLH